MTDRARRIAVVTGSRADWNYLRWIARHLADAPEVALQLIATGQHLVAAFGNTVEEVESDGFAVTAKVASLGDDDSPVGIAHALAAGIKGFATTFAELKPDLLVVLGDRYEVFAAAQAAMLANVPIAHIAGGDTTEGAVDEAIRHAITKLAHLHFVTNAPARDRVVQMGEDPNHVFLFGSPGLDSVATTEFLSRDELAANLGIELRERNLLVTFHPVTLTPEESSTQLQELLRALDNLGDDFALIFTLPNADPLSSTLASQVRNYAASRANAFTFTSLGTQAYLSVLREVDAVVGNSSSGLYEAPVVGTATVNIGSRQRGRVQASSVVNCEPDRASILQAITQAVELDTSSVDSPYGAPGASKRIADTLTNVPLTGQLLQKHFRTV